MEFRNDDFAYSEKQQIYFYNYALTIKKHDVHLTSGNYIQLTAVILQQTIIQTNDTTTQIQCYI